MITSFLLTILNTFLLFIVGFLPTGSLPLQISTSIVNIWGYVNAFSYVIALDTLIQVVVLAVAFDLVMLLWYLINWILKKIPWIK